MKIMRNGLLLLPIILGLFISGCTTTPQPLSKDELKEKVAEDMTFFNNISNTIYKPITLDEAIQRAIKNNIKHKVQLMESALSYKQIDLVYYDMLPSLTANAGYASRDNYSASASTTFVDGKPTALTKDPTYSISQDKQKTHAGISYSWNILDFGLSYVRAQQQADKYLMAKENERKVVNNITQEVRRTYYKTVSADALLKQIVPMMKEVEKALADSRKIKRLRLDSPMQALRYQRDLLEVLKSLQTLERNLSSAKIELSELMGLKAGTQFTLAEQIQTIYDLPELYLELYEMEKIALENRPEILESRYKERISEKEITSAILKMLPGINLNAGLSYDDNDYLLNNTWTTVGTTVSWNLLNIFKLNQYKKIAQTQLDLAKEQKLAISMAILSQVHLSVVNFNQAKKEYILSKEYLDVAKEIFELTKVNDQLNMTSKLVFIKEKLNYILASLRHSSSYANVQNSYGRIFASLGTYDEMNKKRKKEEAKNKNLVLATKNKVEKVYKKKVKKSQKVINMNNYMNESRVWSDLPRNYSHEDELIKIYMEKNSNNSTNIEKLNLRDEKIIYKGISSQASYIRKEPDWNSEKVILLPKDKEIKIYGESLSRGGTWYKTKDGYINKIVIKIKEEI